MNVYFRSPDVNGGCLFAPWAYENNRVSGDTLVFRSPKHPNGGCIFVDPSIFGQKQQRKSGNAAKLYRDDDDILTVIMAAAHYWR